MKSSMMAKEMMVLVVITLMILKPLSIECRDPVLHMVGGGRSTWRPDSNFAVWSKNETFFVGDWLYFGFDKKIYNVLEVNMTSYENCDDNGYIKNVTRGGRDVFNLTEAKTYYFLCGRGFCSQGMKLQVHVIEFSSLPLPDSSLPLPDADLTLSNALPFHAPYYVPVMLATSLLLLLA